MSCHRLAMQFSLREGLDCYDFLAGDARYKRVLSDGAADLHWIEAAPALSPLGLHLGLRLGGRAGAVIRRRFWTRRAASGVD